LKEKEIKEAEEGRIEEVEKVSRSKVSRWLF